MRGTDELVPARLLTAGIGPATLPGARDWAMLELGSEYPRQAPRDGAEQPLTFMQGRQIIGRAAPSP